MRRLTSLIGAAAIVALAVFAVTNRAPVALDLWPLPILAEAPAFILVLGALAFGTLLGALMAWAQGGATRRLARARGREVAALAAELDEARRRAAMPQPGATPGTAVAIAPTAQVPSPALQAMIAEVSRAGMPAGIGPAPTAAGAQVARRAGS